jgi:L-fuculose-phosphate aldolase
VLPEVILTLGGVPLTEYATPSTPEVPASIERYIRNYNAMLLRSHGVLTFGNDIYQAYFRMETVEHFADITLAARALGGAPPLPREEVQKLLRVREALGVSGPIGNCVSCGSCSSGEEHGTSEPRAPARASEDDIIEEVLARLRSAFAAGEQSREDDGSRS